MHTATRILGCTGCLALLALGCDEAPKATIAQTAGSSSAGAPDVKPPPSAKPSAGAAAASSAASKKPSSAVGEPFDWPLSRQQGETIALPAGDDCTSPKSSDAWQSSSLGSVPRRSIELVDAGKEPRKALRYALSAGTLVERRMDVRTTDSEQPDWRGGDQMPVFARVRCIDDKGRARIEVSTGEPSFINTQWFVASSQGVVTELGLGAAPGEELPPMEPDRIMALAPTLLPDEEVGLGAVWRVKFDVNNGMAQVDEFRLVVASGSEARTELRISQARTAKAPADQLEARGKGEHRIDLGAPLDARWQWAGNPKLMFFGMRLTPQPPPMPPLRGAEDTGISDAQQEAIRKYLDSVE